MILVYIKPVMGRTKRVVGTIMGRQFNPTPLSTVALTPEVLRGVAELIDQSTR